MSKCNTCGGGGWIRIGSGSVPCPACNNPNQPRLIKIILGIVITFLSFNLQAQTTFPNSRFEVPDSIILIGEHSILKVYLNQDSVIVTDGNGDVLYLTNPTATLSGRGPNSTNIYGCYVFQYGDQTIVAEYFYNPYTRLWGIIVDTGDKVLLEGMEVIRPFPPLRLVPLKPIKPLRASK